MRAASCIDEISFFFKVEIVRRILPSYSAELFNIVYNFPIVR